MDPVLLPKHITIQLPVHTILSMDRNKLMILDSLQVAYVNVHGLGRNYSKLEEIAPFVQRYHICVLSETWHKEADGDELCIDNFIHFHVARMSSSKGRNSGGIVVYIKSELKDGVRLEKTSDHAIWLRLCSDFFGFMDDVYLGCVYLMPDGSPVRAKMPVEPLTLLEEEVVHFAAKGELMLLGDFNARTGSVSDLLDNCDLAKSSTASKAGKLHYNVFRNRITQDAVVNSDGRELLSLCLGNDLVILNGRCIGDFGGSYTSYQPNGNSTIDYGICMQTLLHRVKLFRVYGLQEWSDHSPIMLILGCRAFLPEPQQLNSPLRKFCWRPDSADSFRNVLHERDSQLKLRSFVAAEFISSMEAVTEFSVLLQEFGSRALDINQGNRLPRRKRLQLSESAVRLRTVMRQLNRAYFKNPNDKVLRNLYYETKKSFLRRLKQERRDALTAQIGAAAAAYNHDPQRLWSEVNKLQESVAGHKTNELVNCIEPEKWTEQFASLGRPPNECNQQVAATALDVVSNFMPTEKSAYPELDQEVRLSEVMLAVRNMKAKKSSSDDLILLQMLKAGLDELAPAMTKVFNLVLSSGEYPCQWRKGFITPLFKHGDRSQAKNYRGVTVTSTLSKVFETVLNKRIVTMLEQQQLLSEYQFGFRKGRSTSDAIFNLRTLVDLSLNKNEKLYACFVDFKAAFPSVNRTAMLYKLHCLGVRGKLLALLIDMYREVQSCVKIAHNGLTNFFDVPLGVREGCVLSPTLFNCYINGLPDKLLEASLDVPRYDGKCIPCLMYADDVVLLSRSREGIQASLATLEQYCCDWQLTVNVEKTKLLVFNKAGRLITGSSSIQNALIENVTQYVYLGVMFVASGSFVKAQELLVQKATKAFYVLCRCFPRSLLTDTRLFLRLFDTLVVPIVLYAIEARAHSLQDLLGWRQPLEKLHLRCCRYILGVHNRASLAATVGELGRWPLQIKMQVRAVAFWARILSDPQCLASKLYITVHKHLVGPMAVSRFHWFRAVQQTLAKSGYNWIWLYQVPIDRATIKQVEQSLQDQYAQTWHTHVSNAQEVVTGKLRTYCSFKSNFEFEPYLRIGLVPSQRHHLARFRISAHKLEIERGRYARPKKQVHERLCKQCQLCLVEDEKHFLLKCPKYGQPRVELLMACRRAGIDERRPLEQLFVAVMREDRLAPAVAKFLVEATAMRDT